MSTELENKKIELEITPLLSKKVHFLGTMQQIVGVFGIIIGTIICFGIIYAIVGIPYIIAGVYLFKSGSNFKMAISTNSSDDLANALIRLSNYWLTMLIAFILTIVVGIVFFTILFSAMGSYY